MYKYCTFIIFLLSVYSCTMERMDSEYDESEEKNVVFYTKDYLFGEETRSSLSFTNNSLSFEWSDSDAIGVFPVYPTTNSQASQVLRTNTLKDKKKAVFSGAGWKLKVGNSYSAYYPYNGKLPISTPYSAVPLNMTGQSQKGNDNPNHISNGYDFMFANATVPENGELIFNFQHVGAIIQLQLVFDDDKTLWAFETADSLSLLSATLANTHGESRFATQAYLNTADGTLTAKEQKSSITLDLEDISVNKDTKNVTLYFSVLPTATGKMKLSVKDSEGRTHTAELPSLVLEAGKAYRYSTNMN